MKRTLIRNRGVSSQPLELVTVTIVAALCSLGLVMILSGSYTQATEYFGRPDYYLARQFQWVLLGGIVLTMFAMYDYRRLQQLAVPLMVLTTLLLLAVLMFGSEALGARRTLVAFLIQPTEIALLISTIYIAHYLSSKGIRLRNASYSLVAFAVWLGLTAVLLALQPDFDSLAILILTSLVMFFVAGASLKQLFMSFFLVATTFIVAVSSVDYASRRLTEYLEGLRNPTEGAAQVAASLMAIARGGLFGRGLLSSQGAVYLPFTDSIIAVVGEELGFIGLIVVIALFIALAYQFLRVAFLARDSFGMMLACGLSSLLSLKAFINFAGNTAVIPPVGVNIPFISYGGSALVAALAAVGITLSISYHSASRRTLAIPWQGKG